MEFKDNGYISRSPLIVSILKPRQLELGVSPQPQDKRADHLLQKVTPHPQYQGHGARKHIQSDISVHGYKMISLYSIVLSIVYKLYVKFEKVIFGTLATFSFIQNVNTCTYTCITKHNINTHVYRCQSINTLFVTRGLILHFNLFPHDDKSMYIMHSATDGEKHL